MSDTVGRTSAQVAAVEAIRRDYPPPFVVGWHCATDGAVRGSIYRSAEDDEAERVAGMFSVYGDGSVTWWAIPEGSDTRWAK